LICCACWIRHAAFELREAKASHGEEDAQTARQATGIFPARDALCWLRDCNRDGIRTEILLGTVISLRGTTYLLALCRAFS